MNYYFQEFRNSEIFVSMYSLETLDDPTVLGLVIRNMNQRCHYNIKTAKIMWIILDYMFIFPL